MLSPGFDLLSGATRVRRQSHQAHGAFQAQVQSPLRIRFGIGHEPLEPLEIKNDTLFDGWSCPVLVDTSCTQRIRYLPKRGNSTSVGTADA